MVRSRLVLLGLLALVAACTAPKSKVCRDTCAREAECRGNEIRKDEESTFDEGECVAACAALEGDTLTKPLVTEHARCVKEARDCAAVLECK